MSLLSVCIELYKDLYIYRSVGPNPLLLQAGISRSFKLELKQKLHLTQNYKIRLGATRGYKCWMDSEYMVLYTMLGMKIKVSRMEQKQTTSK